MYNIVYIQVNHTPIFYAVVSGSNDVVKMLLDKGANIDKVTNKNINY